MKSNPNMTVDGRYSRQLAIEGFSSEVQAKLKASRILLAGAGGLGCAAGTYLALAGIGELVIVDAGRIELSNLNRQFLYETDDIGESKAEVCAERLSAMNPECKTKAVSLRLDEDSAFQLLGGVDLAIDALDNYRSRLDLNAAAVRRRIPLVHGAVDSFSGQVMTVIPGKTPCLACLFGKLHREVGQTPVIGAVTGIVGSLLSLEAIKLIGGLRSLGEKPFYFIDAKNPRIESVSLHRDVNCPHCSGLYS